MKKVLLTTVQKPLGVDNEHVMAELYHAQVTRSQDIFSLRSVYRGWGIEFIANNLKSPATVLHYPDEVEFKRELRKKYDYVGINFAISTAYKARRLIEITRRHSPRSKIILGGYGTALNDLDDEADYVCRGEGLQFMRDLLGEKPTKTYKHPKMVNELSCLSLPTLSKTGVILAGLGCPNGCDFCCTSHFFKTKHIPLLKTGKDIYDAMKAYDDIVPNRDYAVIDEDFLKNKKRVEELYEHTSKETERPMSFSVFSSAKSVARYTPEYLVELGVDSIWIGVESKFHKYDKNNGIDLPNLFQSLHRVGINTLGSMILGMDEHNKYNIWEDIDYLLSLNPTLCQFIIFSPCPGTPLYNRLVGEKRLIEDYPFEKQDGFHLSFQHDNFKAEELEKIILSAFQRDYDQLGPSILRYIDKCLEGYNYFKNSDTPIHIARRNKLRNIIIKSYPLINTAMRNAPTKHVRQWLYELKTEIKRTIDFSIKDKAHSAAASVIVPFFAAYTRYIYKHSQKHMNPKTMIRKYNFDPSFTQ